jgi:hypothetical protein
MVLSTPPIIWGLTEIFISILPAEHYLDPRLPVSGRLVYHWLALPDLKDCKVFKAFPALPVLPVLPAHRVLLVRKV